MKKHHTEGREVVACVEQVTDVSAIFEYAIQIKAENGNETRIVKKFKNNAECQKFIEALNPVCYSVSRRKLIRLGVLEPMTGISARLMA